MCGRGQGGRRAREREMGVTGSRKMLHLERRLPTHTLGRVREGEERKGEERE